MRFSKFLALNAAIALALCCSFADAQSTSVPSARFRPLPAESPEATTPFVEPGSFDYDAQMFAPYDFRDLSEPRPPVGFYFTLDRVNMSVSRPGPQPFLDESFYPVGNDFMWGNRFEGGVIGENESGWGFEYTRLNGSFFSWGTDASIAQPFLTQTAVNNLKLNRIFRQGLSSGGWVEPYFGLRYFGISDHTNEVTSITFNATTADNRFKQDVTNSAVGGHVGVRVVKKFGRFGVASDGSLAAAFNTQRTHATDIFYATPINIFEINDESTSFIPALDYRFDLSYAITRDLALRAGVQMLYLWEGVNRANTLTTTLNPNSAFGFGGPGGTFDESFITAGFNVGVEWRR
jgi:hypothetical protein